ncbi:unnamed protein product [Citrullus colocynthis]|uniref:V-type proton ATPase subunit G n=1 Tax=Citrullus colocynthis TaxID=252529 RepID=A0ABP0YXM6_9ROSI
MNDLYLSNFEETCSEEESCSSRPRRFCSVKKDKRKIHHTTKLASSSFFFNTSVVTHRSRFPLNLPISSLRKILRSSVVTAEICIAGSFCCVFSVLFGLIEVLFRVFGLTSKENMATRGQGGIQQLLAAEQEAQHIVNAARNAKMARLKQAKEEAEKEIAAYRAQVESEFQRKLAESSGDSGANVKRLEIETDEKINHLKEESARISHDVVNMLLKHVTTVKN